MPRRAFPRASLALIVALLCSFPAATATAADVVPLPPEPSDGQVEGADVLLDEPISENTSSVTGNLTGADVLPANYPLTLSGKAREAFINAVSESYATGGLSQKELKSALGATGVTTSEVTQDSSGEVSLLAATATTPDARTLTITHRPQALSYYCGPATAQMVLSWDAYEYSAWDGALRSQSNLAKSTYLYTTAEEGTAFSKGRMPWTLNRWIWGNTTGLYDRAYESVAKPSVSAYKALYQESIGRNGKSIAVGTVEIAGSYHYNGHPTGQTIGHWIVNYGYDSTTTSYADPANILWDTNARFSGTTNIFIDRYVTNGNGAVYMWRV